MNLLLLAISSVLLIILGCASISANAQYFGNGTQGQSLGECIGGWSMCPEQRLAQRLESDQKNALYVIAFGVPSLAAVAFLAWRKRK